MPTPDLLIKHFSPSSLNSFDYCPGKWALRYLFDVKEDKPMFWRGKAVETGFNALLHGQHLLDATALALVNFDQNGAGERLASGLISDEIKAERLKVELMVKELAAISDLFGRRPVATQLKVEYYLDGIPLPFLMFLDFVFEDMIIELKTSDKAAITQSHKRQGALYSKAKNMPVSIVCVTPKKSIVYPLTIEERDFILEDVRDLADSILATISDRSPLEILRMCRVSNSADREMVEARQALLRPTTNIYLKDGQTRKGIR